MHKTMFSRKMSLHFILKKKALKFIETVAPLWSVCPQMLDSRVQFLKRFLFAGLAFARVIVLNIRNTKWRLLPRLFSEALETGTAPCLQCTKVERSS